MDGWRGAAAAMLAASLSEGLAEPRFLRRSPPYVPPPPSEDLIAERLRLAAAKRARKAAKRMGGE